MRIAFLEYDLGVEGAVRAIRVRSKDDLPPEPVDFRHWRDWAEPGEVYQARDGFLYLCVQLTQGP